MLSRVADTIYWLARYMERTQAMLQVIRIQYIASQDEPQYGGWQPLLYTYGDLTDKEIAKRAPHTPQVLYHLVFDRENAASVYHNIVRGRENARAVQDHITKEVWQSLNDYYHLIRHDRPTRRWAKTPCQASMRSFSRACCTWAPCKTPCPATKATSSSSWANS